MMSNTTDTTTTDETPTPTVRRRVSPSGRSGGPKPMRYKVPPAPESEPEAPQEDAGRAGLDAEEFAAAAASMAEEAAQAQDGTTEEPGDVQPETATWATALRPPVIEPGDGADDEPDPANAEAAKFRLRAKAAEDQLSATREQLESYQRRAAEGIAANSMANAADLWLTDTKVGDLIDESGAVDPKKVAEAVNGVLKERPHWGRSDPYLGLRSGATGRVEPRPASWASALGRPAE